MQTRSTRGAYKYHHNKKIYNDSNSNDIKIHRMNPPHKTNPWKVQMENKKEKPSTGLINHTSSAGK